MRSARQPVGLRRSANHPEDVASNGLADADGRTCVLRASHVPATQSMPARVPAVLPQGANVEAWGVEADMRDCQQ